MADIFSKRVNLKFLKQEKFSTLSSKIMTIVYLGLLIAIVYTTLFNDYQQNLRIVESIQVSDGTREFIKFGPEDNKIAFMVQRYDTWDSWYDPEIFQVKIKTISITEKQNEQGATQLEFTESSVNAIICEDRHFSKQDFREYTEKLNRTNLLCIPQKLLVGGKERNGGTQYLLQISLQRCSGENQKCKEKEIIDANMKRNYFSLVYLNNFVDKLDHQQPIKQIPMNKPILVTEKFPQTVNIDMKKQRVSSNKGMIFDNIELSETVRIVPMSETVDDIDSILTLNFDKSELADQFYFQNSGRLTMLLSEFLAIAITLYFFLSIFLIPFHERAKKLKIFKSFYQIRELERSEEIDRDLREIKIGQIRVRNQNRSSISAFYNKNEPKEEFQKSSPSPPQDGRDLQDQLTVDTRKQMRAFFGSQIIDEKTNPVIKKNYQKDESQIGSSEKVLRESNMSFSFNQKKKEYLNMGKSTESDTKQTFAMKNSILNSENIDQIIAQKFDLVRMIKKLEEVDLLKQILLDDTQRNLFQFIDQPVFSFNPKTNHIQMEREGLFMQPENLDDEVFLNYFINLQKRFIEQKASSIDRQIFRLIDQEVIFNHKEEIEQKFKELETHYTTKLE